MSAFVEWFLRRGLKQVLKRNLANLLVTEVDVEQLGVQLDKGGVLELRDCLLDVDYINERWCQDSGVEFASVLVGRIQVTLFPPGVLIEDADVALRQQTGTGKNAPASDADPSRTPTSRPGEDIVNESSIGEGVKLIARHLQSMLRRVKVESRRLVVRLEAAGGHRVTANLDSATFLGLPEEGAAPGLAKMCSFEGLAVQIADPDKGNVVASLGGHVGCCGAVSFCWPLLGEGGPLQWHHALALSIEVGGLHFRAAPTALGPVMQLVDIAAAAAASRRHKEQGPSSDPSHLTKSFMMLRDREATIVEALRLPLEDGEHLLEEEPDEFFDAVSDVLSQSMFSTASLASMMRSVIDTNTGDDNIPIEGELGIETGVVETSPLVAPVPVDINVALAAFSIALDYPAEACLPGANLYLFCSGARFMQHCTPTGKETGLSFQSVEVSEHLPTEQRGQPHQQEARSTTTCIKLASALRQQRGHDWPESPSQEQSPFVKTITQLEAIRASHEFASMAGKVLPVLSCISPKSATAIELLHSDESPNWQVLSREVLLWLDMPILKRLEILIGSLSGYYPSEASQASPMQISVCIPSIGLALFLPEPIANSYGAAVPFVIGEIATAPEAAREIVSALDNRGNASSVVPVLRLDPSGTLSTSCGLSLDLYFTLLEDDVTTLQHVASVSGLKVKAIIDEKYCGESRSSGIAGNRELPSGPSTISFGFTGALHIYVCRPELVVLCSIPELFIGPPPPARQEGFSRVTAESFTLAVGDRLSEPLDMTLSCCALDVTAARGLRSATTSCSLMDVKIAMGDDCPVAADTIKSTLTHSYESSGTLVDLYIRGLAIADDFLSSTPSISRVLSLLPSSRPSADQSFDLNINAKDVYLVHRQAQTSQVDLLLSVAVLIDSVSGSKLGPIFELNLHGLSGLLKKGGAPNTAMAPNLLDRLKSNGFSVVAKEKLLQLRHSELPAAGDGSLSMLETLLRSQRLEITLDKNAASCLKLLLEQLPKVPSASQRTLQAGGGDVDDAIQWELAERERSEDTYEGGWYDPSYMAARENRVPDPGDQAEDFLNSRAIPGGDGAWFAGVPPKVIYDYIASSPDVSIEGMDFGGMLPKTGSSPCRRLTITGTCISLALADSLVVAGFEVVRGRFEAALNDCVYQASYFDADPTLRQRITAGIGSLHARHCVHSAAIESPQWQDCIFSPHLGRGISAARLVCEGVTPIAGATIEWRSHLNLGSTRIDLEQLCVMFLQEFFSGANSDPWEVVDQEAELGIDKSTAFIQRCQVDAVSIIVSYKPARVDLGALRKGSLLEVLHVVPEWNATLWLKELRLRGVHGLELLVSMAATKWMEDVMTTQMGSFVTSLPGLRTVCRIGSAAKGFGALPQTESREDFNRQLQRAVVTLLRAIAGESLAAAAAVAGATSNSDDNKLRKKFTRMRDRLQ